MTQAQRPLAHREWASPRAARGWVASRLVTEPNFFDAGSPYLSHPLLTAERTALEVDFVANAKGYSERKGISYAAWRELGVEPAVLKQAGVSRGG